MSLKIAASVFACAALAGCGGKDRAIEATRPASLDWRRVATETDRTRLRTWRDAWVSALAKARASGHAKAIAAEGALFEPDRALDRATPPPGRYRCRVFKLGARGAGSQDFQAFPPVDCRVDAEGDVYSLYKTGGAQRPVGLVFPDGGTRGVFLGTMMLGDEKNALEYGRDRDRDMAGIVQRIGPARWRLALPYPRFESLLDVVELVPAK